MAIRLLLILNEAAPGAHVDVHDALGRLVSRGDILQCDVVPWVHLRAGGRSDAEIVAAVLESARRLAPDAVLWSHTGDLEIGPGAVATLRAVESRPVIGYVDWDLYQRFYKPMPKPTQHAMALSDVVFTCGGGAMVDGLVRGGCGDIRYVPLTTDSVRFAADRPDGPTPEFDVVLIGNNPRSRVPFKTMPGCRWRAEAVGELERRLGSRFAVFGEGWSGRCAQGSIPYRDQGAVYQKARIALGINNLHAPYYFSDRLPIAMSSGVFMVHNREPGFEELLPEPLCRAAFSRERDAMWRAVERALEMDDDARRRVELAGREFALATLTTYDAFAYMVAVLEDRRRRGAAAAQAAPIANPWLRAARLNV